MPDRKHAVPCRGKLNSGRLWGVWLMTKELADMLDGDAELLGHLFGTKPLPYQVLDVTHLAAG
jgi:hypothetical protein